MVRQHIYRLQCTAPSVASRLVILNAPLRQCLYLKKCCLSVKPQATKAQQDQDHSLTGKPQMLVLVLPKCSTLIFTAMEALPSETVLQSEAEMFISLFPGTRWPGLQIHGAFHKEGLVKMDEYSQQHYKEI